MKAQLFTIFVLVVGLALVLTWAVAAQGPEPSVAPQHGEPPPQPTPAWDWDGEKPFRQPVAPAGVGNQAVSPTTLTLGQPVLGFRYARTFGETEVPYFDDAEHLNDPAGVGIDGTNVWIAEGMGRRALKYASDGTFLMKIGRAGFYYGTGTTLSCLRDVAVDGGGNIWVVDGAHHVVKFNSSGSFVDELGVTWNSGTGNDRFNDPYSIAFDRVGNLYISDSGNHRIQVFNSNGIYSTTIGVTGVPGSDNTHFNSPRHISVDSNNRLYVADANNHRVQVFDVSNVSAITYVATIGISGVSGSDNAHFNSPQGVAVDVTRGRIYVADAFNWCVQVFDYTTREYLRALTAYVCCPEDVAVDSAGNLYVAEPGDSRVQQLDSNLNYVRTYGTTGVPYLTDGSHYNRPFGVAVTPDGGSIYIGEAAGRRLIKLNAAGMPQWIIGEAGIWGNDNEHFGWGGDVAVDVAGRVYVGDLGNCRIQIYNPDGSYYATLSTGCGAGDDQFIDPIGLTVAPNGEIYVADTVNHRVQIFNSERVHVATMGVTGVPTSTNAGFNSPMDVAVDSRGTIYISDNGNHRVQVFDSSRTYVRTIGTTGVPGGGFDCLNNPTHLTVDTDDDLYIADSGNARVQVFDSSGAYLTTVGGSYGSAPGQMRDLNGLAVDVAGNLYAAEYGNHRVQKFAPYTFAVTNTDTYGWFPNGDFAYTYTLVLTEVYSRPTAISLGLIPEPTWPFTSSLSAANVNLPAQGTVTVTAWVTIPSAAILPTTWLSQTTFTVTFSDLTTGAPLTETLLRAAVPLPKHDPPHTLLNTDDVTRMKSWAATYAWAASLRDQIVSNANAWPAKYLSDYNLTSPDLPPEGGQWSDWYICPDGTELQYVPTHSPPHYCPSTGQYYVSPPQWPDRPALYDQVIYGRRHYNLAQYARFLGLAYQLTGNHAYADSAASILRAYATRYLTYPQHDTNGNATPSGGRVTSETLSEAEWLIDMAWAYDLIASSDALSPADHAAIATGLLRPAVTVIEGHATFGNWQTWHNAAMAIAGLALDDPRPVANAFCDSGNGFFAQLAQEVVDGFWREGSWTYHFFALNALLYMAEMGVQANLDPYAYPNLRAMLTAPLQMAAPDLTLPAFNDSMVYPLASGWYNWLYEVGYNRYRYPDMLIPLSRMRRPWQALLWGAESLPAPIIAVPMTSALFSKAGYAALRTGPPDDLRYLVFDFGPHGGWHGHYDKLGYVPYALGKTLGTDPGTHSYASALHDGWDRTTVAHNTVVVDEQNQLEATGNLHRYLGLPALSLATADAGPVYPNWAAITRTLVLNADYWLDVARATSLDGNLHRYDWVYHNPGIFSTPLSLTPYSVFTTTNGYDYLSNAMAMTINTDWQTTWDLSDVGKSYGSVWWNKDGITASFTITDAVASNGSLSGQLDYDFGVVTDGYIVYYTKNLSGLPNEAPTRFGVRVYGDGSNNGLTLRVLDATGEKFGKDVGNITWTGWNTVESPVDYTWWHSSGDNDGIIDPPVSQVALQVSQKTGAASSGRLFADEIALAFPLAGSQIVEDFESGLARVKLAMLGVPGTTVVSGNGIDYDNRPIPFIMARRQAKNTTFAAVFEPYRQSPRITAFEALSVAPAFSSQYAFRIGAAGQFTDTLLLVDEDTPGNRTFGNFTTDATVAYLRQDTTNNLQTLVLANVTKLADGPLSLFTSTMPITIQVVYTGDAMFLTLPTIPTAQLRIYASTAQRVLVNNIPTPVQRDGQYLIIALPPNPVYSYLPLVLKNR